MNSERPAASAPRALLSLARPLNAAVSMAGIGAAGCIAGVDAAHAPALVAAVLGGTLIGAAGNIINDVHDVAIDRVNKPDRAIASGAVSAARARRWAHACAAGGIALSLPAGVPALWIAAAATVLLYAYSARLKRVPLLGNIVVAVVTAAAFPYGAAAAGNAAAGAVPAVFAFLFNLGREILKDIEDMPGDGAAGLRTWPLLGGPRTALAGATAVFAIMAALTPLPYLLGLYDALYLGLVLGVVLPPLAVMLFRLWHRRAWDIPSGIPLLRRVNAGLKILMIAGIAALLAGVR